MKRFDKGYIYYHLLSDLFGCLIILYAFGKDMFFGEDANTFDLSTAGFIFGVIFITVYILFILYRIFYYKTSGYELTEREIKCKRGVLFKKSSVLEYTKIHAINKKQNIIHKIFRVAILTVDSGSANTAHQAEIIIVEKATTVDGLLSQLHLLRKDGVLPKNNEENSETVAEKVLLSQRDSLYNFTSKKKLVYSLVNIVSTAIYTTALGIMLTVVIGICQWFLKFKILNTFGNYLVLAIGITLGAIILLSIVSFVGSIIHSFVGYHNFKITKKDNDIEISFGLLESHTNTFSYDRIKGVKISQSFMQRILGFASIKLEVIGYANETGNDHVELGVLVPFCNYSEVNDILKKILPNYIPDEKQITSKAFFPFFSWASLIIFGATFFTGLICFSVFLALKLSWIIITIVLTALLGIGFVIFLINLLGSYFSYKTNGLGLSDGKITAYSGGFSKTITVLMAENLVAIEDKTTPLRKKAGITSFILHLKTNALSNEIYVNIQDSAILEKLENMLTL